MPRRQLKGTIISDKMQKTVVVSVERIKEHKKYKRRYKINKKYKAHDEKGEYKLGDKVIIEECKPISKDKRWKVVSLIERTKVEPIPEFEIEKELKREKKKAISKEGERQSEREEKKEFEKDKEQEIEKKEEEIQDNKEDIEFRI